MIEILVLIITVVGVIIAYGSYYYTKKQVLHQQKVKSNNVDNANKMKELTRVTKPLLISSTNLDQKKITLLSILIEGCAKLLEEDKLSGSWGKTIGKYMELTQEEGKWSESDVFKYLLTGSLTHAYHALNGLCDYYTITNSFFKPETAKGILDYLKTWRINYGAFATPVINFDGSKGNPEILARISHQIPQVPYFCQRDFLGDIET
jgi:hypothetical protein